ncbi:hypothetical protein NECAME_11168 [Necator americanus]|uniref:Phlebovirus glycoprotein G2 fusion domain-containing protein n=1 Tax=Necator americanus TaxID=51031 RepID=W2T5K1_NECAM|nr:hypothetical protein NECAME_11168 [Necator americanus]ETN77275.1 hypothetical protein NECAME_11168 [Necator americanus]
MLIRLFCVVTSTLDPINKLRNSLRRPQPQNPRKYINRRRRAHNSSFFDFCVISLIAFLQHTEECLHVISINTHEELCFITDNAKTCTYDEATIISLQPLQQETCLALRDRNNKIVALISLKVDNIQFRCQKNVEFFTRDHKLMSESIHRCYLAGSCVENACETLHPTTN